MAITQDNTPNDVVYTKNPVVFAFTTDSYEEYNARMYATIVINGITIAVIEERPHPTTHQYVFKLQTYLDDYISEYDFLKESELDIDTSAPICSKTIIEYTVAFEEIYGEAEISEEAPTEFTGKAIKGGINFESYQDNTDFFENYLPSTKQFLTWLPLKTIVSRYQPVTLYLYNYSGSIWTDISIEIEATLFNGTTISTETHSFPISNSVDASEIMIVPCGPVNIDLFNLFTAGLEVLHYTVHVVADENIVSEVRTFVLDRIIRSRDRVFAYVNSLGGVDHILTTGKAETKGEYSGSVAEREVPLDLDSSVATYNRMDAAFFDYNIRENLLKKVKSGPKTLREADCFRDFRLSPLKMEYLLLANPKYVPITFEGKNIIYPKDNANAPGFEFSYRYGFENNTYTPADAITPVAPSS